MRRAVCILAAVTVSAISSFAQGPDSRPGRKLETSIGAGIVVSPRPYDGVDSEIFPVPVGSLRYGRFWIQGVSVGYRILGGRRGGVDVFARPRFDGFEPDDSAALRGMAERELSADLGFSLSLRRQRLELELSATRDVLDRSDGKEVTFETGFPFTAAGWRLTPGVAAVWQGDNLVEYYYGVRSGESLPGRPEYRPDSALSGRAKLTAMRRLGETRWSFLALLTVDRPGEEIRDSPIVDASVTTGGFAGLLYSF